MAICYREREASPTVAIIDSQSSKPASWSFRNYRREIAMRFTDERKYFVSEASVYRLLKARDLISSPAYVVISRRAPAAARGRVCR
jgi:hypothetical protein